MSSEASDHTRPEAIEESLQDIKCQLQLLQNEGSKISTDVHGEQDRADRIQTRVEKLGSEFNTLSQNFVELTEKANNVQQERHKIDDEYTNLLQEKIKLLEEEKLVRAQLQTLDVQRKLSEEGKNLQDSDVENEKKLLEFIREDLAKKKDDIVSLERRLEEKIMERDREWEGFKDDIRSAREEKRPYSKNIQELDNLVMSRFKGILRFAPQVLTEEDREKVEITIQNLEIKKEIEDEREQLLELELQARDLQQNTCSKLLQRKALWRQFDNIHEKRYQLLSSEDASLRIKKTENMENLLADPADIRDLLVFDCGDNELLLGGKSLHRCHKNMNISIPLTNAERNELEAILNEGEETSGYDDEETDVETEQIQRQINLEQFLPSTNELLSDLGDNDPSDVSQDLTHEYKNESGHEEDKKNSSDQHKDVAKNVLKQAEGNISNPNLLLSKIQNKLIGPGNRSAGNIAATGGQAGGSRMPFLFQRLKSDSSYKVDPAFKRNKRH